MAFAYIWEYRVDLAHERAFVDAYGENGDWVRLFARAPGYIGTQLLRDAGDPTRFVTIDRWRSREDRDSYRLSVATEFDELDRRCETFTQDERFLGDFNQVGASGD